VRARVSKGRMRASDTFLRSITPENPIFRLDALFHVYSNGVIMRPQGWPIWLLHDRAGRRDLECRKKS
jgi:hypothetical protein